MNMYNSTCMRDCLCASPSINSYEDYANSVCSLEEWQADFLVRVTWVVRVYLSQVRVGGGGCVG